MTNYMRLRIPDAYDFRGDTTYLQAVAPFFGTHLTAIFIAVRRERVGSNAKTVALNGEDQSEVDAIQRLDPNAVPDLFYVNEYSHPYLVAVIPPMAA